MIQINKKLLDKNQVANNDSGGNDDDGDDGDGDGDGDDTTLAN